MSVESACPPHAGNPVTSTPGMEHSESPSIDVPADTDLCEQTDQPLLGSERISSYPQFTDDCSKCKDIKYHTSSTDHDTAMRQLYRGPPFHRKCVDCNCTIFDTSQLE